MMKVLIEKIAFWILFYTLAGLFICVPVGLITAKLTRNIYKPPLYYKVGDKKIFLVDTVYRGDTIRYIYR